jgi:hypothetical protein
LGAFAVKDLKEGDIILVEKPLVRTDRPSLHNAVQDLDSDDKLPSASLAQSPEGEDTRADDNKNDVLAAIGSIRHAVSSS